MEHDQEADLQEGDESLPDHAKRQEARQQPERGDGTHVTASISCAGRPTINLW